MGYFDSDSLILFVSILSDHFYRDLKIENLLLDGNRNIKIIGRCKQRPVCRLLLFPSLC